MQTDSAAQQQGRSHEATGGAGRGSKSPFRGGWWQAQAGVVVACCTAVWLCAPMAKRTRGDGRTDR